MMPFAAAAGFFLMRTASIVIIAVPTDMPDVHISQDFQGDSLRNILSIPVKNPASS